MTSSQRLFAHFARPRARLALLTVVCALVGWPLSGLAQVSAAPPAVAAPAVAAWPVVGRQGIVLLAVVPVNQADRREAYTEQIALLCGPAPTCFINFFSNSTGASLSLPLPAAVANEPTAIFRRSAKQGAELFRWSCRMKQAVGDCF